MNRPAEVIVAASSAAGRSPRCIIRLSGDNLSDIIHSALNPPPPPRRLSITNLLLKAHGLPAVGPNPFPAVGPVDDLPLPCLALYFPAPHSYTGQDVLELQIPGNPALLDRVMRHLISAADHCAAAMRHAEAGEFTRRAFLAGKLDLTKAEGIAATIGAVSDAQLAAAKLLRNGRLGAWATQLVDRLAHLLALVEAGIDFVDQDDVVPITPAALDDGLCGMQQEIEQLQRRSRSWSALEALPWVVLTGRSNVGKSTLFNALLGRTRAVTSALAGTTRDVLCESLGLHGAAGEAEVMLVDIAGLDRPEGALDRSMQSAARDALQRAELILHLSDRENDADTLDRTSAPVIAVCAKCDQMTDRKARRDGWIHVSALTGEGLNELRQAIGERLADRAVSLHAQMLALQPRHAEAVRDAGDDVAEARRLLAGQLNADALTDMELIADCLRAGLDRLEALGGRMTPDDVIGRIFATFCIGK